MQITDCEDKAREDGDGGEARRFSVQRLRPSAGELRLFSQRHGRETGGLPCSFTASLTPKGSRKHQGLFRTLDFGCFTQISASRAVDLLSYWVIDSSFFHPGHDVTDTTLNFMPSLSTGPERRSCDGPRGKRTREPHARRTPRFSRSRALAKHDHDV